MSEVLFVQNGWIQDGRIQDGCHHQVESEWMSLSQIELVWVRVQNGWIQDGIQEKNSRWLPSSDWISWVSVRVDESVFEWIWEKITRCLNPRWQCLNPTWQSSRWLPSSSWVRMNEFEVLVWVFVQKIAVWVRVWVITRIQDQDVWIQDGRIQDGCHH